MATALPRAQLCGGGARGGRRVPLFARVSGVAEAGGRGDRLGHRARMPAGRRRRARIGRRVDILFIKFCYDGAAYLVTKLGSNFDVRVGFGLKL